MNEQTIETTCFGRTIENNFVSSERTIEQVVCCFERANEQTNSCRNKHLIKQRSFVGWIVQNNKYVLNNQTIDRSKEPV
jgi:hypothetical protein